MFGRQDSAAQPAQDTAQIPDQSINNAMADDSAASGSVTPWQHPGAPLDTTATIQPPVTPLPALDSQQAPPPPPPLEPAQPSDNSVSAPDADGNDLIDIKQQALSQLTPLVGHLDQSPEEKFRTTMMMIQASDDQGLIRPAFEAAQQIQDEKARAQALLDIINEINYFTQHQN